MPSFQAAQSAPPFLIPPSSPSSSASPLSAILLGASSLRSCHPTLPRCASHFWLSHLSGPNTLSTPPNTSKVCELPSSAKPRGHRPFAESPRQPSYRAVSFARHILCLASSYPSTEEAKDLKKMDDAILTWLPESVAADVARTGQQHLLTHLEALGDDVAARAQLVKELQQVDFCRVSRILSHSLAAHESGSSAPPSAISPIPYDSVAAISNRSADEKQRWQATGMRAIAAGQLAVLLLAGGQGTRLGSSKPKGCYDIGLPSHKSLFQLHAERIRRIQTLAAAEDRVEGASPPLILWLVMTSPFTHDDTLLFFQSHDFFGLLPSQVHFFQQGSMPCFDLNGKIILETTSKIARAPDGNGGVFTALRSSGCLQLMVARGVRFVEVLSVDNALARVADPCFLGSTIDSGAPCAAKVVEKAYPQERVGVFATRGGKVEVVEYHEIPTQLATAVSPQDGKLLFNWSNICMHLFSTDFLQSATDLLEKEAIFHVAFKSIPSLEGKTEGVKLEQFIFDVFRYASSVALFEVAREEEFGPVKNAPSAATDSPLTARRLLLALHAKWVEAAGGVIIQDDAGDKGVEVSPLKSYSGEGLSDLCQGKTFQALSEIR